MTFTIGAAVLNSFLSKYPVSQILVIRSHLQLLQPSFHLRIILFFNLCSVLKIFSCFYHICLMFCETESVFVQIELMFATSQITHDDINSHFWRAWIETESQTQYATLGKQKRCTYTSPPCVISSLPPKGSSCFA